MTHPSTRILRALPHFLIKYLKNSLKSQTSMKSKLPNQSIPCFAVQNGKIRKSFQLLLKKTRVWLHKYSNLIFQRNSNCLAPFQKCLESNNWCSRAKRGVYKERLNLTWGRRLGTGRPNTGKGNHYAPSETEIYMLKLFSKEPVFSPLWWRESKAEGKREKQITVLQQVPTYFHPIQGCAWPYPKFGTKATSQ